MSVSLLQVIKVGEVRKGVGKESGKPYEMQEAECLLLNDDGSPAEVGVLMVPKDRDGKLMPLVPGVYTPAFSLRAAKGREGGRQIGPVLVGLTAVPARKGAA